MGALRMPRWIAVSLAALALAACDDDSAQRSNCTSDCITVNAGGPMVVGSGTVTSEVRPVQKFTAIRFDGVGHLVIERAGTESLTVTADDNLLPLYTSEVKDGTLHLSTAPEKSFTGKLPVYAVSIGDLRRLDLNGSGDTSATKLEGDTLSISLAGSGSAKLAGQAAALTIALNGSGSADAAALAVKRAKVNVNGSGGVTVNASDELDARVNGSGIILYMGAPKLTANVAGSGSIKKGD